MNEKGEHQEDIEEATIGKVTVIPSTPNDLLAMLIQKDASLEMVEKFMDLKDRDDAKIAKQAYTEAMAAFKSDPPEIEKDKAVSYENKDETLTEYRHASLGNVTNTINAALGKQGLSAGWSQRQADGGVYITCTITHSLGHSESTVLHAAPDQTGGKNTIQALGSTISYLERYTLLALTGLATKEQDDDGQASGAALEFITEDQVKILTGLCTDAELGQDDIARFLGVVEAEEVRTIPQGKYVEAKKLLDKAVANLKKRASK